MRMDNNKESSGSDLDLIIRNGRIVSDILTSTALEPTNNTCR